MFFRALWEQTHTSGSGDSFLFLWTLRTGFWRVRFRDDRWLYLVLLLEFQSTDDRAMAVRLLTYTGLLYEKLIGEGVLRDRGELPPVLPIVIYNGSGPWTAAADVAELISSAGAAAVPGRGGGRVAQAGGGAHNAGRTGAGMDRAIGRGRPRTGTRTRTQTGTRTRSRRRTRAAVPPTARKFDADTAERLAGVLADIADPERLAQIGDWIIECGTAADLLVRVRNARRLGD